LIMWVTAGTISFQVAIHYFLPLLGWAFPGCHPTS
jgi:hypothetical protein